MHTQKREKQFIFDSKETSLLSVEEEYPLRISYVNQVL